MTITRSTQTPDYASTEHGPCDLESALAAFREYPWDQLGRAFEAGLVAEQDVCPASMAWTSERGLFQLFRELTDDDSDRQWTASAWIKREQRLLGFIPLPARSASGQVNAPQAEALIRMFYADDPELVPTLEAAPQGGVLFGPRDLG